MDLPSPPFRGWPTQWRGSMGFAWFVPEPRAIVLQSTVERVSPSDVEQLQDAFDEIIALGLITKAPKSFSVILDWRSVRTFDAAARAAWVRRAQRRGNVIAPAAIYVAIKATPLLRMVLQAMALTLQVTLGQRPIQIAEQPDVVVRTLRLLPPPADFLEKARQASMRRGA